MVSFADELRELKVSFPESSDRAFWHQARRVRSPGKISTLPAKRSACAPCQRRGPPALDFLGEGQPTVSSCTEVQMRTSVLHPLRQPECIPTYVTTRSIECHPVRSPLRNRENGKHLVRDAQWPMLNPSDTSDKSSLLRPRTWHWGDGGQRSDKLPVAQRAWRAKYGGACLISASFTEDRSIN